ncbi:MAG: SLC13 family permease [Gammaproteobacteria bacterium]
MSPEQMQVLGVLAVTIAMFLWGPWRHDMVALASLLACVALGLVSAESAFSGFGHPAIVTVACVLVLSRGLYETGAVDLLAERALPSSAGTVTTLAALVGLGAALSAFMNNVGAMALLMPVAVQLARKHDLPAGKFLMPLAFGTILGGMTTLIGTPPNLIVAGFREDAGAGSFGMFDFTPVGVTVAAAGVAFIILMGRHLVPEREGAGTESFDTGTYLTEARVTEGSKADGQTLKTVEEWLAAADAQIIGMVRNDFRISAPNPQRKLRAGDILVLEADPEALGPALSKANLTLKEEMEEDDQSGKGTDREGDEDDKEKDEEATSGETEIREMAVLPGSMLIGQSVGDIQLRTRYGLTLLALSRRGRRSIRRLRSASLKAGDVLLMQGPPDSLTGFASEYGCVPLAVRAVRVPERRQALAAMAVMAVAIAGAAFGLLPAAVSFAAGVLLYMALKVMPLQNVYDAVDWPIVILLGALFPVAEAMDTTGTADLLARGLLQNVAQGQPVIALALILILTMTLSDFMNNAATAAVMCPIAISIAGQIGASSDTFLMAVAIGASCAFLTPIGHQNNTLIMGPGGFRFSDYWRLGLPMEILVVAVAVPMLLLVWPL